MFDRAANKRKWDKNNRDKARTYRLRYLEKKYAFNNSLYNGAMQNDGEFHSY